MSDNKTMEVIAMQMDSEAETYRVLRDAARRRGEMELSAALGDKADGFTQAARIIREKIQNPGETGPSGADGA